MYNNFLTLAATVMFGSVLFCSFAAPAFTIFPLIFLVLAVALRFQGIVDPVIPKTPKFPQTGNLVPSRRSKLQELAEYYAENLVEDDAEGTDFDMAVYVAIEELAARFSKPGFVDPNGGIDRS